MEVRKQRAIRRISPEKGALPKKELAAGFILGLELLERKVVAGKKLLAEIRSFLGR